MLACILTFAVASRARALMSTSLREKFLDFKNPPLLACNDLDSATGTFESEGASLASLFSPDTAGAVVDRVSEIAPFGPRDMLLRSRSSVSTRWRVCRGFAGTGRFVAAPGRVCELEVLADLANLGLGGEIMTGPPNFRFMEAQRSGRRAEKLLVI